jgi:hypothetical protein
VSAQRARITALSERAARSAEPVFLCGAAMGDAAVWHLLGRVLALRRPLGQVVSDVLAQAGG